MRKKTVVLALILTISAFSLPVSAFTLTGDINGGVFLGGITYVYAISTDFSGGVPAFYIGIALLGTGGYFVTGVPAGDYLLLAYQDRDNNLLPSVNDYMGYYGEIIPEILTVEGNMSDLDIEIAPLPFTTITGTLSYGGSNTGLTILQAAADPQFEDVQSFSFLIDSTGSGDYTVFADSGLYYVRAFMDLDLDFQYSPDDPMGYYGSPGPPQVVDVTGGSAQNIDFSLNDPLAIDITLDPVGTPIVISAHGGTFDYLVTIANSGISAESFDVWSEAVLPSGSVYGPMLFRTVTLAPGSQLIRNMTQSVPAGAPAGEYIFRMNVGIYPVSVIDFDEFGFAKSAGGDNSPGTDSWDFSGWDAEKAVFLSMPVDLHIVPAYPNPFNASTAIGFILADRAEVSITLYNVEGGMVETVANDWYEPGYHSVIYDFTAEPTGIYFAVVSTSKVSKASKLILIK